MKLAFSQKFRIKLGYCLKWLGSIALICLILSRLDFQHILELMARIKIGFIFLAIFFICLERIVIAARWPILVRIKGHSITFWDAFKMDWIAIFFGMALPSIATGDVIRGYRLTRLIDDLKTSLSSIVLDRMIGFVTLGFMAVLSLFLGWKTFGPHTAFTSLCCFILIVGFIWFFVVSPRIFEIFGNIFFFLRRTKGWKYVSLIHNDISQYRTSGFSILVVFLLSFVTQAIRILIVYIVALSINSTLPFFYFILFVPIVFFIKLLPISIGGFGAREATFAVMYSMAGMASEEGVLVGVLITVLTILFVVPGGIMFLLHRHKVREPDSQSVEALRI